MPMPDLLASIIVLLTGFYLIGLAAVSLFAPARATRFLGGFAGSARAHCTELAVRLIAGGALVLYAPHMRFSGAFAVAGWGLIVTTAALCAVPWRWHRWFARRAVPRAIPHLKLIAVASFLLGGAVVASVILGSAG